VKTQIHKLLILSVAIVTVACGIMIIPKADAAVLTNTYIRLNTMKAGQGTSFRLVFKAASAASGNLAISFNGSDSPNWTTSSGVVNSTQTVSVATCPTEASATALPGTLTPTVATNVITVGGVTALTPGTTYCVDFNSSTAVTNATVGEYHPTITIGSDSSTVAVRTISNDAVTVNANVPPTFNFVLSSNTDNFTSNLSTTGPVDTTGVTATINTNAKTGWFVWAKDQNAGLSSATQSKLIASTSPGNASVQTLANNTEGYLLGITAITQGTGAGTASATAGYDGSGGAGKGDGLDTSFRQIASSNGTAANAVLTIKERASIAGTTPASSDYTDTITLLGAGNF
jgi:hypothetical protein